MTIVNLDAGRATICKARTEGAWLNGDHRNCLSCLVFYQVPSLQVLVVRRLRSLCIALWWEPKANGLQDGGQEAESTM